MIVEFVALGKGGGDTEEKGIPVRGRKHPRIRVIQAETDAVWTWSNAGLPMIMERPTM